MILLNPKNSNREHLDSKVKEMMQKTRDYFEKKGLKKIKEDDQASGCEKERRQACFKLIY